MTRKDFDAYMNRLDERIKKYIPPKENWTPIDEAVYGVKDPYRVDPKDAEKMRLKSIKFAFKRHYEHNHVYNDFCKQEKVNPDDIKTEEDLFKIPVLPDGFFKQYPDGKDFAMWLANMHTGDLPEIRIRQKHPTYDQVIADFNRAGMLVTFSSGTSGRHTFVPRDRRTFQASEYSLAKGVIAMAHPWWDYESNGYLLMPNPLKTNIYAGKALEVYIDAVKTMNYAIDREITTGLIRTTMGGGGGIKAAVIRRMAQRSSRKMIDDIISWLEFNEKSKSRLSLCGAPWILYTVMKKLDHEGRSFDFGDLGAVVTGGGWKVHEKDRLSSTDFAKMVNRVLGIPNKFILDTYGMVECNAWYVQCPEGHYLHAPTTYYKPIILDEDNKPIKGYGETGRLAFLDAAAYSYPGFITTGDRVKLLERCPVCDRPGPVLEPEIKRMKGAEVRGCAEEMRTMMAKDIGK